MRNFMSLKFYKKTVAQYLLNKNHVNYKIAPLRVGALAEFSGYFGPPTENPLPNTAPHALARNL